MDLKHVVRILTLVLVSAICISGCSGGGGIAAAKDGDTVRVHYTGTLDDGTEFDSSVGGDPLEFTVGAGQMISGFDQAVVGMKLGESKTVTIPPEEAYGPYRDDLVQVLDRSQFQEGTEPVVGQQWESPQPDGRTLIFTVIEVTETTVTADYNHRLAGETLTFEIELVEIL
jgi:peptidylprolyl isomerase